MLANLFMSGFARCVVLTVLCCCIVDCASPQAMCPNLLVTCTGKLRSVSSSSAFASIASEEDLSKMCPDLEDGLACMEDYGDTCLNEYEKQRFEEVHSGSKRVISNLCVPGEYREEYLKHLDCFKTVKSDYAECTNVYEQSIEQLRLIEDSDEHTRHMCKAFEDFMACSGDLVTRRCGGDAANFTNNMLQELSGTLEKTYCKDVNSGPSSGSGLTDNSDPVDSSSGNNGVTLFAPAITTSLLSILLVYLL